MFAVVGQAERLATGDADLLILASPGDKLNPGLRIGTLQALEAVDHAAP